MTPGVWDNVLAWETVYLDIIAPLFAYMKAVILAEGRIVEYYEREERSWLGKSFSFNIYWTSLVPGPEIGSGYKSAVSV